MEHINRRLKRILDDIQTAEEKIAMWQEHLRALNIQKEQMENKEIIKTMRSLKLGSREMLAVLDDIQKGMILFTQDDTGKNHLVRQDSTGRLEEMAVSVPEMEENPEEGRAEREDGKIENEDL